MNHLENDSQAEEASNEKHYSRLQQSPEKIVPRRAALLALAGTIIIGGAGYFLGFNYVNMLIAFWIGVVANLINFRLIVIGTHSYMKRVEAGGKPKQIGGYLARQGISGLALLAGAFLGLPAMVTALIGLSMTKFAIQLDTFITFKS